MMNEPFFKMMKSLLVFIPQNFYKREPGCLYGNILHDTVEDNNKFFILGLTESIQSITRTANNLSPLGYFYGIEKKKEYWERKLPNWIELFLIQNRNSNYEYCMRNILINNQKVTSLNYHIVVILYDEHCLIRAELYTDRVSINHFSELRTILYKESTRKNQNKLQNLCFTKIKENIFTFLIFTFLYPTMWLYKATNKLSPILKYSSLGLHFIAWFENLKWTLTTLLQCRRFTLKTTNYILALVVDMLLGLLLLKLLLHFLGNSSPSDVLLFYAEKVVESLKGLVNWLMGSPAGLKLNRSFNCILGKFFLYHIHLWWAFLVVSKPLMELAFGVLLFFGKFGVTFQISIVADLLALLRLIMIGLGGLLTRLKFYLQVMPIYALFQWLFRTVDATGSIGIKLIERQATGPIMLKTKAIIAPWSETWIKSIPDTINTHPPIEWSEIASNVFWGQLLYPF